MWLWLVCGLWLCSVCEHEMSKLRSVAHGDLQAACFCSSLSFPDLRTYCSLIVTARMLYIYVMIKQIQQLGTAICAAENMQTKN